MFDSRAEAKKAGWYSRRHRTEEERPITRGKRREELELKRDRADARAVARAARSDEEQLTLLEARGHGHCVEALKLELRIRKNR